ncbi:MAG: hypothetical protein QNL29_07930, partial [Crocinitomicaceae bacterium]
MKIFKTSILVAISICMGFSALAQPSNDPCAGATPLGTLPTPGACTAGLQNGLPVTLTGQTTVDATAPSPYVYQTGCSGGNMTVFALDTWYSFVASGTVVNINVSGFPNANVAIYSGGCGNLAGRGCAIGNGAGNTSLIMTQATPGQTYYIQISGNSTTATDNSFTLAVDNDIDCNDCLLAANMTASPAPVNGGYTPGQVVTFCYTVNGWSQQNTNWFHGVQISMGAGWTGAVTGTVPAGTQQTVPAGGNWLYYPAPGTVNGVTWPPGFYFDTPDAGTSPVDNFGDNCSGAACTWTFCWNLTVSSACTPGANLGVTVNTSGDGESGSWGSAACLDDDATVFSAIQICCTPPTMAFTPVSCLGGTNGTATATHGQGASPWDYVWTNSSGGTVGTTMNSTAASNTVSGLPAGTYTVTITDNIGCVTVATVTVTTIDILPPTAPNPANINVQCLANVPAPNPAVVLGEADNITAVPTVVWLSDTDNGLTCPKTITRRYRVSDACGLFIDVIQLIIINDNTPPTGTAPANITVQCLADVPASNPLLITNEADNCSTPTVTFVSDASAGTCPTIVTRTYRITDLCGNFINVTQTITVQDNIAPTGTAPANITVQCLADVPASNPLLIT